MEATEDEGREEEAPGAAAAAEREESDSDSDDDKEAAKSSKHKYDTNTDDQNGVEQKQDDGFNDEFVGDDILEEKKDTGKEEEDEDDDEEVKCKARDELGNDEEDVKWQKMEEEERSPDSRRDAVKKKHGWIEDYNYDSINNAKCCLTLAVIPFDFNFLHPLNMFYSLQYRFLYLSPKSTCRCL